MITDSALVALAGLAAVVALLFLLITRFKWHVFLALLVPILLFALIPGIDRRTFIDAFEQGFGRTIQGIAVVTVLGSVLAEALKHTGGIERITASMIRRVGEARMPLAAVARVRQAVFHRAGARGRAAGHLAGVRADPHPPGAHCGTERGGVTLVNGVTAMAVVYALRADGLI